MSSSGGGGGLGPAVNGQVNSLGVGAAASGVAGDIHLSTLNFNVGGGFISKGSNGSGGIEVGTLAFNAAAGYLSSVHTSLATVSAPTSGAAFTPNANFTSSVLISTTATAAGTIVVTMGPTTGAENPCASIAFTIGNGQVVSIPWVPNGWKVVVTLTGAGNTFAAQVITH